MNIEYVIMQIFTAIGIVTSVVAATWLGYHLILALMIYTGAI